jgi:putative ABC transport system permease protein
VGKILFEFKEGFLISFGALKANKVRAILTTLGIVIGICSVAVMATAIKGIDIAFEKGISALGADNMYIDKFAWFSDQDFWKMRNRKNLTVEDYEKFKELARLPLAVSPTVMSRQTVRFGENFFEGSLITGTNDDYVKTTNFEFDYGRFFTSIESKSSRNVVVVGKEIASHLFESVNPLNQDIKIGEINYKIVGVLAEQGSNLLGDFNPDRRLFVPIGTIYKYFEHPSSQSINIVVRAETTAMLGETKEEAEGVMRKVRGLMYNEENDFAINQQDGLTQNYKKTVGVIQIAGIFITGLSLLVGAIGIMNIMFVSVKERTKEIGIRKAIGAKKRVILGQFLTEASVICLIGGLIGLMLAVLLSMLINKFLPTSIQLDTVVLAIVISLITGVLSGLAPAYTAARMDPVDALRYE